jgi:hypothetical protein
MLGHIEKRFRIILGKPDAQNYTTVTGVVVGRFGVHEAHRQEDGWSVTHLPTGLNMIYAESFSQAMILADDFSRFSKKDPSSRDRRRVKEQLGPDVCAWGSYMRKTGNRVSFRQWQTLVQKET